MRGSLKIRVGYQETKSLWWIAWLLQAMKGVASGDTLGGGASSL